MSSLVAIVAKDFRLLLRDRAALVFIAVAPVVVICVAGFSLASVYGTDPTGQTGYELPIVDEDGGNIARQIDEQLANDTSVTVRRVASRAEAQRLVRDKTVGSALVIPEGTEAAIASGEPARLLLYTDPVKYLERLNVRLRLLEARDELAESRRERAVEELDAARRKLDDELARLDAAVRDLRARVESSTRDARALRDQAAAELDAETARLRDELTRELDSETSALASRVNEAVAARVDAIRAPAEAYLDALAETRDRFDTWFAELKSLAARRADEIPEPPAFPEPPPELVSVLEEPLPPIELPAKLEVRLEAPALPDTPISTAEVDVDLPTIEAPQLALPDGSLTIEEISVNGGPTTINTFDQNVPGFSVTFLLLGMLFGVSLGLIDERDWGTFDRVRALPVPAGNVLIGKLVSRFAVGVLQIVALFAVGYALFDISLGPAPWALLLPVVGIAFSGTAFGLIVAVLARSRHAVLPLGSIVIVTMAAVGGCWWPIDLEPRWMRTVALAFPTTWAMDAFNDLMIRRRGPEAAYAPTAVLLGYGLAYLMVGLALFRRRIASGPDGA